MLLFLVVSAAVPPVQLRGWHWQFDCAALFNFAAFLIDSRKSIQIFCGFHHPF